MNQVHNNLVLHALAGVCDDRDCELHNPKVGWSEEVISKADIAFFISGAAVMYDLMMAADSRTDTWAEFLDQRIPQEIRPNA